MTQQDQDLRGKQRYPGLATIRFILELSGDYDAMSADAKSQILAIAHQQVSRFPGWVAEERAMGTTSSQAIRAEHEYATSITGPAGSMTLTFIFTDMKEQLPAAVANGLVELVGSKCHTELLINQVGSRVLADTDSSLSRATILGASPIAELAGTGGQHSLRSRQTA